MCTLLRISGGQRLFCAEMNLLFLTIGCGLFFVASALPVGRLTDAKQRQCVDVASAVAAVATTGGMGDKWPQAGDDACRA